MFRCYHCGRCCEDVATQISLTLGDISRLCTATKKTAVQLYNDGVIGVFPFGNPIENGEYETELGLFIPCVYRQSIPTQSKSPYESRSKVSNVAIKQCSIYGGRPLNCRLFPYWILSEAPLNELRQMGDYHECMTKLEVDSDFTSERKIYFNYREALIKVLESELQDTEDMMERFSVRKKLRAKKTKTRVEDARVITTLIKKDTRTWKKLFGAIDEHLKTKKYASSEQLPQFEQFLND